MPSNRENIFGRIRAALGKTGMTQTLAPTPLKPFPVRAAVHREVENLVGQFCLEVEAIGGHAVCLNSGAEVRSYLEKLLPGNNRVRVALSDSAAIRDLRLNEWLGSRGVDVLPPYDELEPSSDELAASGAEKEGLAATNPERENDGARPDADPLKQYMESLLEADIGMTSAGYGIAETGTLVYVSGGEQHRLISLLPPVHICLLERHGIVPDMGELFRHTAADFHSSAAPPQALTFVTGPSCTADIEQTLTTGIHGPGELHILIY